VSNEREALRRQGLKPKDHAKENMRMVSEMSRKRLEQAASGRPTTPELFKMERFKHTESTLRQQIETGEWQRPQTADTALTVREFMRKGDGARRNELVRASTASGVRPGSARSATSLSTADVPRERQRPQSAKPPVPRREEVRAREAALRRAAQEAPSPDHLRRNALSAIRGEARGSPAKRADVASAASTPERHGSYGRVPPYLLQRKQELLQQKQAVQERLLDHPTDCPEGMRLMRDDERKGTLVRLRESRLGILRELSGLPFLVHTPSMQASKTDMERRLGEVEKAIALYARPRIFVKAD
jgi:hypothetical protein